MPLRAEEPECTGLETTAPLPAVHVQPERPVSKPALATRLVVAAPAAPTVTRVTPEATTAAALSPASVRRLMVLALLLLLAWLA